MFSKNSRSKWQAIFEFTVLQHCQYCKLQALKIVFILWFQLLLFILIKYFK
jgi:hypothetical protein